jgi:hypothetical protein
MAPIQVATSYKFTARENRRDRRSAVNSRNDRHPVHPAPRSPGRYARRSNVTTSRRYGQGRARSAACGVVRKVISASGYAWAMARMAGESVPEQRRV